MGVGGLTKIYLSPPPQKLAKFIQPQRAKKYLFTKTLFCTKEEEKSN